MTEREKQDLSDIFAALGMNSDQITVGQVVGTQVIMYPGAHVHVDNKERASETVVVEMPTSKQDVLDTPEARRLWAIAQDQGWVDENRMPLMSEPRMAILASVMSDLLGLQPRWAAFEQFWHLDDLASSLYKAQLRDYYILLLKKVEKAMQ